MFIFACQLLQSVPYKPLIYAPSSRRTVTRYSRLQYIISLLSSFCSHITNFFLGLSSTSENWSHKLSIFLFLFILLCVHFFTRICFYFQYCGRFKRNNRFNDAQYVVSDWWSPQDTEGSIKLMFFAAFFQHFFLLFYRSMHSSTNSFFFTLPLCSEMRQWIPFPVRYFTYKIKISDFSNLLLQEKSSNFIFSSIYISWFYPLV